MSCGGYQAPAALSYDGGPQFEAPNFRQLGDRSKNADGDARYAVGSHRQRRQSRPYYLLRTSFLGGPLQLKEANSHHIGIKMPNSRGSSIFPEDDTDFSEPLSVLPFSISTAKSQPS